MIELVNLIDKINTRLQSHWLGELVYCKTTRGLKISSTQHGLLIEKLFSNAVTLELAFERNQSSGKPELFFLIPNRVYTKEQCSRMQAYLDQYIQIQLGLICFASKIKSNLFRSQPTVNVLVEDLNLLFMNAKVPECVLDHVRSLDAPICLSTGNKDGVPYEMIALTALYDGSLTHKNVYPLYNQKKMSPTSVAITVGEHGIFSRSAQATFLQRPSCKYINIHHSVVEVESEISSSAP
jgi:hypothetical protein